MQAPPLARRRWRLWSAAGEALGIALCIGLLLGALALAGRWDARAERDHQLALTRQQLVLLPCAPGGSQP